MKKKIVPNNNEEDVVNCAACGKEIHRSPYAILCDMVLNKKPACSFECNKKLGQVDEKSQSTKI